MNVTVEVLLRFGRPVEAATLVAAILHRADQLGLAGRAFRGGRGPDETELAETLTPAQHLAAETEGVRLNWTEMIELAGAERT